VVKIDVESAAQSEKLSFKNHILCSGVRRTCLKKWSKYEFSEILIALTAHTNKELGNFLAKTQVQLNNNYNYTSCTGHARAAISNTQQTNENLW